MEYIDAFIEGGYEPITSDLFSVRYKKQTVGGDEYGDIKKYIDSILVKDTKSTSGGADVSPVADGFDVTPIIRDDYSEDDIFLVTPIDLDNPVATGAISEVTESVLSDVVGLGEDSFGDSPIGADENSDDIANLFKQFKD